ncbi:MAG: translocation/assembly module TamB domain-containing protein [Halioglobus sp.]|nr:translocation/assembly module TamB domain-containing protein [Halioglobus sp.]
MVRSLLLFLLLAVALLFTVSTQQGSQRLLRVLERVLPIEIDYGSGSLSDRLYLERLRLETDGIQIELTGLVTQVDLTCLLRGVICLSEFRTSKLDIALLESSEPAVEMKPDLGDQNVAELIAFPVALEIKSLDADAVLVRWSGGEWRQGSTRGRVYISGSAIKVFSGMIIEPQLALQKATDENIADIGPTVLPRIDLPFELLVDELTLIDPSWDFYGAQHRQDSIVLAGSWLNRGLKMTRLDVSSRDLGELTLHGELAFEADWPVHAGVNIDLAQPSMRPQLFGQRLTLDVQGSLASLAIQLTSTGDIKTVVDAEINVLGPDLPFSATLTATSSGALRLADLDAVPDFFPDVELKFPVVASASGTASSQKFTLQAVAGGKDYDALTVSLKGEHEAGRVLIRQLSILDSSSENALHASGEVVVADAVTWSIQLQSDGVDLPNMIDAVEGRMAGILQLSGEMRAAHWEVSIRDVKLDGAINGLPANISGFAGINSEMRLLRSELDAELNGANVSLRSGGAVDDVGHVKLSIDDISRWQAGDRGQVQLEALILSDAKQFQLSAEVQNIVWRGLALHSGAVAAEYRLDANQPFSLDVALADAVFGDVELSALSLSAQGDATQQSMSVLSAGDLVGELVLTGFQKGPLWEGTLKPTQLQTALGLWQLSEPVQLVWSDATEQLALDAHCWRNQYANLCSDQWLLGTRGRGSVDMSGDIKLFAGLLSSDLDMQGAMKLQVEARWGQDGDIIAAGQAQARNITVTREIPEEQNAIAGWEAGDASFTYDSDGLQLELGLQHEGREIADVKLQLPADRNTALAGSVRFDRLQLTTFTRFIPAVSTLLGELTGELSLSGTVDQPMGYGSLSLSNGGLLLADNPTEMDRLDLTFDVRGDSAKIQGSGFLGGGELVLSGELETRPRLSMALSVDGHKNTILYPPSAQLQVSESLQLRLGRDLLAIRGDVIVHKGSVQLEELPQDSVPISASVVEVDYAGNILQEKLPFKTKMNLKIAIKDKLKVASSVFQTTLGGDLNAKQRPGHPLELFGNLRTIGGEVYAYQSHLKVKRGTLSFSGPPGNPMLDLRAERDITAGNITVGVQVQGPLAEDLELDIYSDPVMSQPNAMSYLLRGRAMDVGAGSDGAALALSLAGGLVNRSSLVSELNSIPGVNNITFGAQGSENDTAATLSGYIGQRIYLSYGIGFYEPINVLTARFYFRSRIWLEIVSSLENSLDLYYSFDIE